MIDHPQIHLRLILNKTSAVFNVFVGHAKHLPFIGNQKQMPDSYVKTYLRTPNYFVNKYWKRKTCVVKNTQNPTYNFQVIFILFFNV